MVPAKNFENLTQYFKGQISDSTLLNKAGRVAAKKHIILTSKKIPAATAVKMAKPLARQQCRLTKRIRLGPGGSTGGNEPIDLDNNDEGMVEGPLENMLRKIIKGSAVKKEPQTPHFTGSYSKAKRRLLPHTPASQIPVRTLKSSPHPKPTSLKSTPKSSLGKEVKKKVLKAAGESLMHSLGLPSTSRTTSKGKQPKKKRKTELEKLAPLPGWENWYPPGHKLRKGLQRDYDSD